MVRCFWVWLEMKIQHRKEQLPKKKKELRKISVVSLSVCLSSYEQGTNHPEKTGGHFLLSLDSENNKELCSLSLFY